MIRRFGMAFCVALLVPITRANPPVVRTAPDVPRYTVTDLGGIQAYDVNDSGEVAGCREVTAKDGTRHWLAVVWSAGKLREYPPLPGDDGARAVALNNRGDVVVTSQCPGDRTRAYIAHGDQRDVIPAPADYPDVIPERIDDRGLVVGELHSKARYQYGHGAYVPHTIRGFEFFNMRVSVLPGLGGDYDSAKGINADGTIVGSVSDARLHDRAVAWQGGRIRVLAAPGFTDGTAVAINSRGAVVARMVSSKYVDVDHVVVFGAGKPQVLMPAIGFGPGDPSDVNDSGDIVGATRETEIGGRVNDRPCLWRNGQMYLLERLLASAPGCRLQSAIRINNRGQILCSGYRNGQYCACILTPVAAARR